MQSQSGKTLTRLLAGIIASVVLVASTQAADGNKSFMALEIFMNRIKSRCTTLYSDAAIDKSKSKLQDYQQEPYAVLMHIRKQAECECIAERAKLIDTSRINTENEKEFARSFGGLIKPIASNCFVDSFKQRWGPFCHVLMKSETNDAQKIESVCQCMTGVIQQQSDTAIIQYSQSSLEHYDLAAKGESEKPYAKSEVEKAFDSCEDKAGIEPSNPYKQAYIAQRLQISKQQLAVLNMRVIATALELYRLHNNSYPSQQQGLKVLLETRKQSTTASATPQPYLDALPKDPWGNEYVYRVKAGGKAYELMSYGHDGKPGGVDFDRDIPYIGN